MISLPKYYFKMKTHYNDVEYAKKMMHKLQCLASFPPPIPFEKNQVKTKEKDEEKNCYKSFEVKLDTDEKDSDNGGEDQGI